MSYAGWARRAGSTRRDPFALAGARSLRALLYGITPFDPAPLIGGAVALVSVAVLAALVPSRNAARVDPLVAIRAE